MSYIIANGNEDLFRSWGRFGGFDWTSDRAKALQFARRSDAELVAEEDEDAWKILEIRDSEFAWLIEQDWMGELRYYAPTQPGEWTADHLKACRFARKEDAEAIQFRNVSHAVHLPVNGTRVVEHAWG